MINKILIVSHFALENTYFKIDILKPKSYENAPNNLKKMHPTNAICLNIKKNADKQIDENSGDIEIDYKWQNQSCHMCLSSAQEICDDGEMMCIPVSITSVLGSGILSVYQTKFDLRLSSRICSICAIGIFKGSFKLISLVIAELFVSAFK